ncbi:Ribonuclease h2 subunit a, partial [Globisporangium splendens]
MAASSNEQAANLQKTILLASDVPENCLNGVPVMLGIDEAGRGPVMGPMVYGAAFWPVAQNDEMSALGFDDSKVLTAESREGLFEKMKANKQLGWIVRMISAQEISDKMQRQTSNLNEMSRNAAIQMIRETQAKGVNVKQVFVDTVGDPKWYQTFLTKQFNGTIEFRVEKKADSLFKVVSAASIAAKVTRDRIIVDWEWEAPALNLRKDFGSGYPSDPKTKAWLSEHMDNVFGFPNIVRFSWGTIEPFLLKAVKVEWPHDKELEKVRAYKVMMGALHALRTMALANCLHQGKLRQFSAQYGGWLSINVVLFGHALVMDPDGDAPSAVVTPRKRRNSVKSMWMELFAVASIVSVRKEDKPWSIDMDDSPALSPPAAARRSRRSSASEFISMGFGFTVVTTNPDQTFQFEAATEIEREEWIRCLLLARKLLGANSSAQLSTERSGDPDAFYRFASSDSEDSNESDAEDDEAASKSDAVRGESSLRSAQPLTNPHHTPIVKIGMSVRACFSSNSHPRSALSRLFRLEVTIPLSESSQEEISVKQIKLDAIQQLRNQLHHAHNVRLFLSPDVEPHKKTSLSKGFLSYSALCVIFKATQASSGLFRDLLRREADHFVLCNQAKDRWFSNEQCPIGYYISDIPARSIHLALLPVNTMPHPTIEVAIAATKNKISDLSQKTYTAYMIDVSFNDVKWQLARRYKEFDALHAHLEDKYGHVPLPKLPSKRLFTPLEGTFVDKRREQLENYLKQMILHPLVGSDVLFLSFLGVVSTSRDRELSNNEKNVLHVTTLHQSLDCGDILLFSCRFGASVLQRKFTGAKYDHVGIVVPGASRNLLRIMEATSEGIQVYSLKARLMAYSREVSNVIAVRRIKVERTPEMVEQLRLFVERVEGNPYSILGILRSKGESERTILDTSTKSQSQATVPSSGHNSDSDSSGSSGGSIPSAPASPTHQASSSSTTDSKTKKRKYFCSSLAASTLKHVGWIHTNHSSSHFWPGSFEDGGEVEQYLAPGITMEPEAVIDCLIVEVGLATQEPKPSL